MPKDKKFILVATAIFLSTVLLVLSNIAIEYMLPIPLGPLVGFIPLWLHIVVVGVLLGLVLWSSRGYSRWTRLGAVLLAAGWMIGVTLPAIGAGQKLMPNLITGLTSSFEFHSQQDPQRVQLACSFLLFSGTPPGATATFYNPGDQPVEYVAAQPPFRRWKDYGNYMSWLGKSPEDKFTPVRVAPSETKQFTWPLNPSMFSALVFVETYPGASYLSHRDRPTVAFCSLLSGSRRGLYAIGALLALVGVDFLGVGYLRNRQGALRKA